MLNNHPTISDETDLERCNSYLAAQSKKRGKPQLINPGPAVTISYQTGAGEHEVARRVAELLQTTGPAQPPGWTVFDRQLIEEVLDEHGLPKAMRFYIPEERRSFVANVMDELLGLSPPTSVLEPQIAETILHLAHSGHVILVGRGGAYITARMPNVFHVRLIAPLSSRIARVRTTEQMSPGEAAKFIAMKDRARSRHAKSHFHGRADDDLLYHLVINTDRYPAPEAASLIADQAHQYFQRVAAEVADDPQTSAKAKASDETLAETYLR